MLLNIKRRLHWLTSQIFLRLVLLIFTSLLSFTALIQPFYISSSSYPFSVGEVAIQDIQAPITLAFPSEVLTEQARNTAENAIYPIYFPADPAIARRQIERMRISLNYIISVRADPYAAHDQKVVDLSKLEFIEIDKELATNILSLSDTQMEVTQQEALSVLELTMRNTIREDKLYDTKRSIPTLINFSLPEEQASIVTGLVSQFVIPNSLYSEEQTRLARVEASDSIEMVIRKYITGEAIVERGQVITPEIWEALEQFGFIQPQNNNQQIISSALLIILTSLLIALYFSRFKPVILNNLRNLTMISVIFLVFLFGARYIIPDRTVIPYLFPIPAFGLTITSLFTMELGMIFSLILSILTAYGLPNSLDLTLFFILSSFCGILVLSKARRIANFFWAGIAISIAGSAVILTHRLPGSVTDWFGVITLIGASIVNGIASASLSLLLQYIFSQILSLTTALQLLEISRPDHPLLQYILRNAPGTYQHSLQVANLAEQAAKVIGADALLVRVGALYHDAGKATNPLFFIENQIPGKLNSHDDLDPKVSAATIIRHVDDGIELAKKYHLPPRIQDFILEHHGNLITRYQYTKAIQAAGNNPDEINKESFRYPGPCPRSRETALLMLADGCEATARAQVPKNEQEIRLLVEKHFEFILREAQLINTNMTLRDLNLAAVSFVMTLQNTYHPRLKYPKLETRISATAPSLDRTKGLDNSSLSIKDSSSSSRQS